MLPIRDDNPRWRFGPGVVESVDPGADPIATVKFSGWGKKRIKAAFLRAGS